MQAMIPASELPVFLDNRIVYDAGVDVMIFHDIEDPTNWEVGKLEGFIIYDVPPLMPIPEEPRPRQKAMNKYLHRKAGHWGF